MDRKKRMRENITSTDQYSWRIDYNGANCKFESSSPENAVIYHLEVPENMRNQGIGTDLIEVTEEFLSTNTDIQYLYVQVGEDSGSTQHVLENKLGFDIIGTEEREELGEVVDAQKKLE